MLELIIGLLGAGVVLVIYRKLFGVYIDHKQEELEEKSKKIQSEIEAIKKENERIEKEANEEIKELEYEKDKDVSNDDIIDFFNNRKRK